MNIADTFNSDRHDVERIQQVLSNNLQHRGCGKTYAKLMVLLGEAYLGDDENHYLYVTDNCRTVNDLTREFAHLLNNEGFKVEKILSNHTIIATTESPYKSRKIFSFTHMDHALDYRIRGYKYADIIIDVSPEVRNKHGYQIRALYNFITTNETDGTTNRTN